MKNQPSLEDQKEKLYLTDYMKKELKGAANWGLFISISLIAFFGLFFIFILSSIGGLSSTAATAGFIGIILVIVFLGLSLGMGILLFLFSSNLKKALIQKENNLLIKAFVFLSQYFILSFTILVVTLLFSFAITMLNL